MSQKAVISGQFNLQDQATHVNDVSIDLGEIIGSIPDIKEHSSVERELSVTDGPVMLNIGGLQRIKGILIYIKEGVGTLLLQHDWNANKIEISKAMVLFGHIGTIQVDTTATTPIKIKYVVFG